LKGTITLDDVDDTLSTEERNIILKDSITGKIDFKKLGKEAGLSDSSPHIAKDNKNPSDNFPYNNLNNSINLYSNRTGDILNNS